MMEQEFDSDQISHERGLIRKMCSFVSQINNIVKITKDKTMPSFGTIKVKGVMKAPNHYNVLMS